MLCPARALRSTTALLCLLLLLVGALSGSAAAAPKASPVLGSDLQLTDSTEWEEAPAVAWNAMMLEYLVVWSDSRSFDDRGYDIYGQRVSAAGVPLGPEFRISGNAGTADELYPAVAWNANLNQYLVVWIDFRGSWADIYGRRVSGTGALVGADFRISISAPRDEGKPAVAFNTTRNQYLVVWADTRAYTSSPMTDIYGQRVRGNGTLAGGEIRVSGAGAARDELNPAVVWNATRNQYLVVWEDVRSITTWQVYGRRFTGSGAPIGEDFRISDAAASVGRPDVAWNGTANQYLVVWEDSRAPSHLTDLYGRRVRATGTPIGGADVLISGPAATSNEVVAAVSWNETAGQFLVVWADQRNASSDWDIYGRKVRATGVPVGADFRICGPGATAKDRVPAVAWAGALNQFLVVWEDWRPSASDIYGRLVAG